MENYYVWNLKSCRVYFLNLYTLLVLAANTCILKTGNPKLSVYFNYGRWMNVFRTKKLMITKESFVGERDIPDISQPTKPAGFPLSSINNILFGLCMKKNPSHLMLSLVHKKKINRHSSTPLYCTKKKPPEIFHKTRTNFGSSQFNSYKTIWVIKKKISQSVTMPAFLCTLNIRF